MKRKDWFVVTGIITSGVLIAFIINWSLTHGNIFRTNLSNDSWLSFWGSYCGGIFAAVVGYLAIIYSNRNSEKAIQQQEKQLKHQQIAKKLDEYNACLKNNLDLLNVVDIIGIAVGVDYQNLSSIKRDICRKKTQIYATDLQYRYVFEVDVPREKTALDLKYDEIWKKSRGGLSDLLDVELNLIERINQNHYDISLKGNYQQRLEILRHSCDDKHRDERLSEIQSIVLEIEHLDERISSYYKDVDILQASIKESSNKLMFDVKILFDLSILLIKEKESLSQNFTR